MRISTAQAQQITERIHHYFGQDARIWLFGSRLQDEKRGGDIDLYVEAGPHPLISELRCKHELEEALDMPLDLIVRMAGDCSPIAAIAKKEGCAL